MILKKNERQEPPDHKRLKKKADSQSREARDTIIS